MAPDPHDVLYENLAEDDINASSWRWLGTLDELTNKWPAICDVHLARFLLISRIQYGSNMNFSSLTCGLNRDWIYWLVVWKVWNMAFMTFQKQLGMSSSSQLTHIFSQG